MDLAALLEGALCAGCENSDKPKRAVRVNIIRFLNLFIGLFNPLQGLLTMSYLPYLAYRELVSRSLKHKYLESSLKVSCSSLKHIYWWTILVLNQ